MIIDGRALAKEILASVKADVALMEHQPIVRAIAIQPTQATESFLKIKGARAQDAGMQLEILRLADNSTTEDVLDAIAAPGANALIVQLPLPDSVSESLILDEISLEKDADVLSRIAYERFAYNEEGAIQPPIVSAVQEILRHAEISVSGKKVVVVGAGKLVGAPIAVWLEAAGADLEVVTLESGSLTQLAHADIIISGAGSPHLITPHMIKEGVVLIDAGTAESNGVLAGDAHPDCASKASVFTPVPGGVGPVLVACLYKNVAQLLHQNTKKVGE